MNKKKDSYIKYNVSSEFKAKAQKVANSYGMNLSDYARYTLVDSILEQTIWEPRKVQGIIKEAVAESFSGKTHVAKTPAESVLFLENL